MCGIYGFYSHRAYDLSNLRSSIQKLEHRGPDDQGYKLKNGLGIAMCRLAINELNTGQQPFISKDDRYGVVFNGEIYNYQKLSSSLGLSQNTSEAEVIFELFMIHGPDFVKTLDGMFAIVIVDFESQTIYMFRDPFGKKPLWILQNSRGELEFASEIKALQGKKTIRENFISEFLIFGYIPFNKSAYKEVQSIPAGTIAIWCDGKVTFRKYWQLQYQENPNLDYQTAKEETFKLLMNAVKKRLISERPIGVYLSGGYDSSAIAAIMKNINNDEINSYTVGFKNASYDESMHAKKISQAIGTIHHEEILSINVEETVLNVFNKLDLPFADSSILPTFLLNKVASKNIVVALGGDGGDEIFGGYDRYVFTQNIQKFSNFLWMVPGKIPFKNASIIRINRKLERLKNLRNIQKEFAPAYTSIVSLSRPENLDSLIKGDCNEVITDFIEDFESRSASKLRQMMLSDVNNYLHGDLLVKADLASMFNGVEVRSPFLDKDLAQFVYTIPDNFLVKGTSKKILLKDIVHDMIPRELLDRSKMGFGVPMDEWLRQELRALMLETFTKNQDFLSNWLHLETLDELVKRQLEGENLSRILWPLLALSLWAESYL